MILIKLNVMNKILFTLFFVMLSELASAEEINMKFPIVKYYVNFADTCVPLSTQDCYAILDLSKDDIYDEYELYDMESGELSNVVGYERNYCILAAVNSDNYRAYLYRTEVIDNNWSTEYVYFKTISKDSLKKTNEVMMQITNTDIMNSESVLTYKFVSSECFYLFSFSKKDEGTLIGVSKYVIQKMGGIIKSNERDYFKQEPIYKYASYEHYFKDLSFDQFLNTMID